MWLALRLARLVKAPAEGRYRSMSRRTPDQTPVTQEEFDLLKAELVLGKAEIDWVPYS